MNIQEIKEIRLPFLIQSISNSNYVSGQKFYAAVNSLLCNYELLDPYKKHRYIALSCTTVTAGVAQYFFIPICLQLGPIVGPITAVFNSIGYLSLGFWSFNKLLHSYYGPRTKEEFELLKEDQGSNCKKKCRVFVVLTTAGILALASQLSSALPGFFYNEDNKTVALIALLVGGALPAFRSLQLSLDYFIDELGSYRTGEIRNVANKMKNEILAHLSIFTEMKHQKRRNYNTFYSESVDNYLLKMLTYAPLTERQKKIEKYCNILGKGIGQSLSGMYLWVTGEYTYWTTKAELIDNNYVAGTLAVLAVGSTAWLINQSIVDTTQRVFKCLGSAFSGREAFNFGWQYRAKYSFVMTVIGLFISFFTALPTYQIFKDFYKTDHFIKQEFLAGASFAAFFLLVLTAVLDLINDIISNSIQKGSEEEQEIVRLSEEFQRLAQLIETCPCKELVGYLFNLDEDAQKKLLDKINVTKDKITEAYHASHP